jgi:hypothetical protein
VLSVTVLPVILLPLLEEKRRMPWPLPVAVLPEMVLPLEEERRMPWPLPVAVLPVMVLLLDE